MPAREQSDLTVRTVAARSLCDAVETLLQTYFFFRVSDNVLSISDYLLVVQWMDKGDCDFMAAADLHAVWLVQFLINVCGSLSVLNSTARK